MKRDRSVLSWGTVTKLAYPYAYLFPAALALMVIVLYPLAQVFNLSLQRVHFLHGQYIGLSQYRYIFRDQTFWLSIKNNLLLTPAIPILTSLSILLAILLYEQVTGWRIYRTTIFLPYILSIVVVGVVFQYILSATGFLNMFLDNIGLASLSQDWLGDSDLVIFSVMGVMIWKRLGFGVILFLARLLSLDKSIFEAAKVDGASWWQVQWYVAVPQLRGIIEFFVVLQVINNLAWTFTYIYTMTAGGPGWASFVLDYYIYDTAIEGVNLGKGSAAAVVLFLVSLVFVFMRFRLLGRQEETEA